MSLRQQNKAKVREAILAAASDLFVTGGLEKTTTRTIAQQAGVSYQTLYNYFPTKSAIARELLNEDFAHWSEEVTACIKAYDGNLIATLVQMDEAALSLLDHPDKRELWHCIVQTLLVTNGNEQIETLMLGAHERYYALLRLAQGMGHLRADLDLHLMAHTLFSLSDYAMLIYFLNPTSERIFLQTRREQLQLLLTPYLQSTQSTQSTQSPSS